MQLIDGSLILSATDLINYVECEHLTFLDKERTEGRAEPEGERDEAADLIARKGDEHEAAYLEALIARGARVAVIPKVDGGLDALADAVAATEAAMREGFEVIHQAAFFNGQWRGFVDFLERVERPSDLGEWSYEPADTKLARRVKPYFLMQLCLYAELVESVQGLAPEWIHVVLGSNERESFRLAEYAAYYREVKRNFCATLESGLAGTYPHRVAHCDVCRWAENCEQRREDDDYLGLVANMRREQIERLSGKGIGTVAQLAVAQDAERPVRIGEHTFQTLRHQAELQVHERETGQEKCDVLPPEDGRGFERLPLPNEGDMFFDMEGDPFFQDGLEYLFGVTTIEEGKPVFHSFWGKDRAEEKQAFEAFIDFATARLREYPEAHIYHYASYEATALKRLMGLHATREDEVDDLLRGRKLVDLYAVVRQALRISKRSYSLKQVEAFYMPERHAEVKEGGDSILEFERYLEERDESILEEIERYNEEDCLSTLLLREWLLERRSEAEDECGHEIPWFAGGEEKGEEPEEEWRLDIERIKAELTADVPDEVDPADWTDDQRSLWLMAQLVDYHRREAKPAWWEYFARRDMSDEDLAELDNEALGCLEPEASVAPEPVKRSLVYTLTFPTQDHKLAAGEQAIDPATGRGVNIEELDDVQGIIRVRRGVGLKDEPLPSSLIPGTPYGTTEQRAAVRRVAQAVLHAGLGGDGAYRAARDVLARAMPRIDGLGTGSALHDGPPELERIQALARGLDRSHLFVQGPPGSGKTYRGAHVILDLLAAGRRVGVTAQSHKAIHNLLHEVEKFAGDYDVEVRGLHKASGGDSFFESKPEAKNLIGNTTDSADCRSRDFNLVSGTAWLFCREDCNQMLDHLVIDEAGQISLADALAMATSTQNLILLGDPAQLGQVTQGTHPAGSGRSVLEHLLDNDVTVPPERGVFLSDTRRMHPDVCEFISEVVYEDRLRSISECSNQHVESAGLAGTGVRYVPVAHHANTRSSAEEVQAIAAEIDRLGGARYTKSDGTTQALKLEDIMVVAPYNAQVRCLREHLPEGVRIGTVDKFQGQEAAIVFFSMATSSGAEIPRNVEFLFSRNRLNVAISRARCLGVLVCSPELLHLPARNVEQMKLVNALCRLVELAPAEVVA